MTAMALMAGGGYLDEFDVPIRVSTEIVSIDTVRDGRFRSRMTDEIRRVDAMLSEWGRWGIGALAFLGLPAEALISRVARLGFTGAAQRGPMPEPSEYILLTERAVLKIQQIERSVIAEEYCQPWEPRTRKARNMHMNSARYGKVLERGRKSVRKELLVLSHTFR